MRKRKICIVTGSRAEWGLLSVLAKQIKEDPKNCKLQIIATGAHLSPEFGLTYKEIEKDGFRIDRKVKILSSSDSPAQVARSMGMALAKLVPVYESLAPDVIVVLGDRYEIFSAVIAALLDQTPVAHICGGEITEGALDDYFRHCITKMSHLHFTAAAIYRRRVIQLGENPRRVFNTGTLALDNIFNLNLLSKKALEKEIDFKFNKRNLLVTFHPVTLENNSSQRQFQNLLDVLDDLKDTNIIFTKANADSGGKIINRMIDRYVSKNLCKTAVFASMGKFRYLSALKYMDAAVGNSSSGIIETSALGVPTVNIGDRQKGRVKPKSVIDCKPTKEDIKKAIRKSYSKSFRRTLSSPGNLYGDGQAAKKIKKILLSYDLDNILKKTFYNLGD